MGVSRHGGEKLFAAAVCVAVFCGVGRADRVAVVEAPSADAMNTHYVGDRAPLEPSRLIKLPVKAIEPGGWLLKQLQLQAAGFHGHLEEISPYLAKKNNAWLDPRGVGVHGWEEVPYWLRGYLNAAFVLRDPKMIAESGVWIDGVIGSQQPDGWFGPAASRHSKRFHGKPDLWPNMVMLFCLQDDYEYTADPRIIGLMTRYFAFLRTIPDADFLPESWGSRRAGDLLFSVYWLYNRTGEKALLDLAAKVHRCGARWDKGIVRWHNVDVSESFGEPTTWWLQSHDDADLNASSRNWRTVRDAYGQVPGGMFGADENARRGYTGPRQAVETCGMVEAMLSDENLVAITADLAWADRCEDVAFNSLPAAMTADMKALRYLTAPNMVESDARSKNPEINNGGPMFLMNPYDHRCCQHNSGMGWPYLAEHLVYATSDNGLAAVFYAASTVHATVGSGAGSPITLTQETHYPFDSVVTFTVHVAGPVEFPLYLRIPGWCDGPAVKINGEAATLDHPQPDHFIALTRTWHDGDRVELSLPMHVSVTRWTHNHDSASINYGPLTFSLKIGEKYVRHGGTEAWPAWEIDPTTPWNYGLVLDGADAAASFRVVHRDWPADDMPFTHAGTPIELVGQGRRVPDWRMDAKHMVGRIADSPVLSEEPIEPITLIPMGAARLRISAFPVIGSGAAARAWPAAGGG